MRYVGPGWWQASDGKWYAPESMPSSALPPPPAAQGSVAEPDDALNPAGEKRPGKGLRIALVLVLASLGIGITVPLATSGGGGAAPVATTAPSSSPAYVASDGYLNAYNKMIDAVNAQLSGENSTDSNPTASAAAWKAEIAARQAFDATVSSIAFPNADQHDAQKVLSADAALESAEGTLSANTNDVANYNLVFDTVTSAQAAFVAADTTLSNDLGLTSTTTPTT